MKEIQLAIFHCSVKNGSRGKGKNHARYISASGRYSRKSDCVFSESGNLPEFAKNSPIEFFGSADKHERKNGRTYKEIEVSLPRELSFEENLALMRSFIDEAGLQNQPYLFAIHSGKNGANPHSHLMFSERPNADFGEDVFFKRNGSKKDRAFHDRDYVKTVRKAWEVQVNKALAEAGVDARVDCRTLKAQGIDRMPQPKIGFAAAAIEARRPGSSERVKRFKEVVQLNREKAIIYQQSGMQAKSLESLMNQPRLQVQVLKNIAEIKDLKSEVSELQKQEIEKPRLFKNLKDFVESSANRAAVQARIAQQSLRSKKSAVAECKWYQPFLKAKLTSELSDLKMTFSSAKKAASEKAKNLNRARSARYKNKVEERAQKLEQANHKIEVLEEQLELRFGLGFEDLEFKIQNSELHRNQEMQLQMQREPEPQEPEQSSGFGWH